LDVESVTRARRTCVTLFERGDVERDAGEILQHDGTGRAALKPGERLDVPAAADARVDRGIQFAFFRHERDELVMIRRIAVRAVQGARVPLCAASAAAETAAPLDAADFGKGRPRSAHRTVP